MNTRKLLVRLVLGGLGLFVVMQLVPYGRDHVNPKVTREVPWPDARTKELAKRACLDCHSNETVWPWYSNVAPISWLVYRDTIEGRKHLNFSEWDKEQEGSDNTDTVIKRGKMPFKPYLIAHPEARLTDAEKAELIKGLVTIQNNSEPGEGGEKAEKAEKEKD